MSSASHSSTTTAGPIDEIEIRDEPADFDFVFSALHDMPPIHSLPLVITAAESHLDDESQAVPETGPDEVAKVSIPSQLDDTILWNALTVA